MYFAMSRADSNVIPPGQQPNQNGPSSPLQILARTSVVVKIAQKMSAVPVALACISTAAIRPDTSEFLSEGSLYYRQHESLAPRPTKTWTQIRKMKMVQRLFVI